MSAANNCLQTLPPSLGNLTHIQELNLDGNKKMHPILQEKYKLSLPALLAYLQSISSCLHLAREHEAAHATSSPGSNVYIPGVSNIDKVTEKLIYESDTLLRHGEFGVVGRIVDVRRAIFRSRAELCTKIRGSPLSLRHVGLLSLTDDVIPSDPSVLKELKSFDVSHNSQLIHLSSFQAILPRMTSLLRLNLRRCGLQLLPKSWESGFVGLISLQSLDLSENALTELDSECFVGGMESTLRLLDLSSNSLSVISGETISRLTMLKTFMYHGNKAELTEHPKLLAAEEMGSSLNAVIAALIGIEKGFTTHTMREDIRTKMIENRLALAIKSGGVLDLSSVLLSGNSPVMVSSVVPDDLMGIVKDFSVRGNRMVRLPNELSFMFRLVRLDASDNCLTNNSLLASGEGKKKKGGGGSGKSGGSRSVAMMSSAMPPTRPIFDSMRMLLTLDLSNNKLGPDLPLALAKMTPLLQVLSLFNNDIERMETGFVTSSWSASLRTVTLRGNPLPDLVLDGLNARGVPGLFAALSKVDQDHKEVLKKKKQRRKAEEEGKIKEGKRAEEERRGKIQAQLST
jgi:Leucine-rich repeat (LRR) protein